LPPDFFEDGHEDGGKGKEAYGERDVNQIHGISLLREWG
jgi:hypothetical protein